MLGIEIKRGASRTVLLVWKFALKFPSGRSWRNFLFGLLHNMSELEFSRMDNPTLCPILCSLPLGLLVVMPRCIIMDTLSEYSSYDSRKRLQWIVDDLCSNHLKDTPVEPKLSSFGYLPNGKIVAVDYGG